MARTPTTPAPPTTPTPPASHPALGALAALVGTWRGDGVGDYPTIEPFAYREEAVFAHDGRPVLAYRQRTWKQDSDMPMHAESGYVRGPIDGHAELVIAQPTGFGEIATLAVHETDGAVVLEGTRTVLHRSPSAKLVTDVRRRFRIEGDTLRYDLWMTYAGHEDHHHLRAVLGRI